MNETYGYEDFISDEEQSYLLDWTYKNENNFVSNNSYEYGDGKKIGFLHEIDNSPMDLVQKIKDRIVKIENIEEWILDPNFKDAIGINYKGAEIHLHTDPNVDGYTHVRYNVILQYPKRGGHSIYNGKINKLKEKMVWRCVAGKIKHGSTKVIGKVPRITLTLGFQIKDRVKRDKTLM